MAKILIVEDDEALAEELVYFLSGNGYETDLVKDFSNILYLIFVIIMILTLNAFKTDVTCIISVCILFLLILLINFIFDFHKRKKFYDDFGSILSSIENRSCIFNYSNVMFFCHNIWRICVNHLFYKQKDAFGIV